MSKILIKTSDPQMFLMLRHLLSVEGFDAELVTHLNEVTEPGIGAERNPSVLILDGEEADFSKFLHIREKVSDLPLVLLARGGIGAKPETNEQFDLVLPPPFDPLVLLRFLRRYRCNIATMNGTEATKSVLTYCDLLLNRSQFRVYRNGQRIDLTPLQFRLLETLTLKPEIVWSRQELIDAAWGQGADVEPRTVDIHIGHIRRALARYGPNLIRTVQARGYALDRSAKPLQ